MIKLTINGKERYSGEKPITISEALHKCGVSLPQPCGGKGICGKCAVKVRGQLSLPIDYELENLEPGLRLACQTYIEGNADIVLNNNEIPSIDKIKLQGEKYSIAVDIGTTNIKNQIIEDSSYQTIDLPTYKNPLSVYGADVISIISNEKDIESLINMQRVLLQGIIDIIKDNISNYEKINSTIILSGNTTMLYIASGISIKTLGQAPYLISEDFTKDKYPIPKELSSIPLQKIIYLPIFSAFLGGDFCAGMTYILKKHNDENILFADLGTNGEIFLKYGEKILAASVPMGPALEGGNITFGSCSIENAAIHFSPSDGFKLGPNSQTFYSFTGSCFIDLIAYFLSEKIITEDGNIQKGNNLFTVTDENNSKRIYISDRIYISQKDIRNFQLAKSALYSSVDFLIMKSGIKLSEINKIIISGNFGSSLNLNNFIITGFIPEFPNADFITPGNTSLLGAINYFRKEIMESEILHLKKITEIVKMESESYFKEKYISSLNFGVKNVNT